MSKLYQILIQNSYEILLDKIPIVYDKADKIQNVCLADVHIDCYIIWVFYHKRNLQICPICSDKMVLNQSTVLAR